MTLDPFLMGMAMLSLAIGLSLYLWMVYHPTREYFVSTNIISWLLIALFPVLIIFSFFPSSSFDSNIKGVSIGGAIGAFIFIWMYGTKTGARAVVIDEQKARISRLEAEVKRYRETADPKRRPTRLSPGQSKTYKIKSSGKLITLFTGGIDELKSADIWVSSENTNMQMARFFDRSISGTVRYLGAKKDELGTVREDIIAQDLDNLMKDSHSVQPATVLVTRAGELLKTHNVKKIFHVAAVYGQVSSGYQPIQNIHHCVTNSLQKADSGDDLLEPKCKSIALPLFGTGTARGEMESTVRPLLESAIFYLSTSSAGQIQHVYFLTWLDVELEACTAVLDTDPRVSSTRLQ